MDPDLGHALFVVFAQNRAKGENQVFDALQCFPGIFKVCKPGSSQRMGKIKKIRCFQHKDSSEENGVKKLLGYYTMSDAGMSTTEM
jgi:hypothetical protein